MSEQSPLDRLQAVVDEIRADEQAYRQAIVDHDPSSEDSLDELRRWAHAAFGSAEALQPALGVDSATLFGRDLDSHALLALLKGNPLFVRALEEQIAPLGLQRMAGAVRRVEPLVSRLVTMELKPFAKGYLAATAQLYLWGFDAQVFPMARAALESALKNVMADSYVFLRLGTKPRYKDGVALDPTLAERISALEAKPSVVDEDVIQAMHDIRLDGNDILHTLADPIVTRHGRALDVITSLAQALGALDASRGGR